MMEKELSIMYVTESNETSLTEILIESICDKKEAVTILDLIQKGADVNAKDSNGYTPLQLASQSGQKVVVDMLIDSGAKVDGSECPYSKRTLLHHASIYGWTDIVKALVNKVPISSSLVHSDCLVFLGENNYDIIHARDMRGKTALHLASDKGNLEVVKFLVEEGAVLHARDIFGSTVLHIAAERGHLEVVKCLMEIGADLHAANNSGNTVLHLAAERGHLEVVKYLVEKGVTFNTRNKYGDKALHSAAMGEHLPVVKFLVYEGISSGAVVNCSGRRGSTVLHYASQFGWIEMVQSLVKRGPVLPLVPDRDSVASCAENICPTIHAKDMDGRTALNIASFYGHLDVVKCLVVEGADLNEKSNEGMTALQEASSRGHIEVGKYLIEQGADINAINKDGRTVLYTASSFGHLKIVKFLVEKGADMNVRSCQGTSPLLAAARASRANVVHLLMDCGANFDGWDEEKCTLLHYASKEGWMQVVQSLVNRGSDLNAKNNKGQTALLLASRNMHIPIVEFLLKAGASWDIADAYGNLPLTFISGMFCDSVGSDSVEIWKSFIEAGAYLKPIDYFSIMQSSRLRKPLLRDVNFCCQAVINKFNFHDLPALYKLPVSVRLPCIKKFMIVRGSKVARTIERTVKREIKKNKYCHVLKVHPMVLSVLSVRSVLEYYDNKKSELQKKSKRLATSDSKNEYQLASKSMRLS